MVSVPHDERTGLCTSTMFGWFVCCEAYKPAKVVKFSEVNHPLDCTVQGGQRIEKFEVGTGDAGSYTNMGTPDPKCPLTAICRRTTRLNSPHPQTSSVTEMTLPQIVVNKIGATPPPPPQFTVCDMTRRSLRVGFRGMQPPNRVTGGTLW